MDLQLRPAGGDLLQHFGDKSVGCVSGEGLMKIDYAVMGASAPLVSVAKRFDKNQLVIFGPKVCRMMKDPHTVNVMQEMAKATPGFDMTRIGNA